jgi:WD40 repeat protein
MCVWDTATGKLIHQINDEYSAGGMPAISDDGRYLVSQGEDPNWTPPPPECSTPACYGHTLKLQLWDFKKEKVIRSWPGFYSNNDVSMFMKFAHDGKHIFASDGFSSHIYDIPTGIILNADVSGNQAISNDDRFWANEYAGSPRITSTSTGKIIRIMRE